MRTLTLNTSFFSDGEFLDEYEHTPLETKFGDTEAVRGEIFSILESDDEFSNLNVDYDELGNNLSEFWNICIENFNPKIPNQLTIADGTYETNDQFETFTGEIRLYLMCYYEPPAKAEIPDPTETQLTLF